MTPAVAKSFHLSLRGFNGSNVTFFKKSIFLAFVKQQKNHVRCTFVCHTPAYHCQHFLSMVRWIFRTSVSVKNTFSPCSFHPVTIKTHGLKTSLLLQPHWNPTFILRLCSGHLMFRSLFLWLQQKKLFEVHSSSVPQAFSHILNASPYIFILLICFIFTLYMLVLLS